MGIGAPQKQCPISHPLPKHFLWCFYLVCFSLYPDIIFSGELVVGITSIHNALRLNNHDLTFFSSGWLMLHTFRNNNHFTFFKRYCFIPEFYNQFAVQHNECFICIIVGMPHKFALYFYQFEIVTIHFGDHPWGPVIRKFVEFFR